MEFTRIKDTSDPMWPLAWKVYQNSFPLCEQRQEAQHIEAMSDPAFNCNVITDDDKFIGIMMWWDWTSSSGMPMRFIEHFATDSSLRGGGYGARALQLLIGNSDRLTMLEIDPPEDEISRRREGFYMRNGLATNTDHLHIHPSFRKSTQPHQLMVMSYPRLINKDEFIEFRRFNLGHVLTYVEK